MGKIKAKTTKNRHATKHVKKAPKRTKAAPSSMTQNKVIYMLSIIVES